MVIYNVTVKTEAAVATDYINWLHQEHIPEILQTGCFSHANILRLLDVDESEGPTFVIQYRTTTLDNYKTYLAKFAGAMREKSFARWGDRIITFRTVMQSV
ncbi:MAG: DUF4286 family protein [Terrimonas sp.]|nr:DUF4286 family protein [Terrimonas sp.]